MASRSLLPDKNTMLSLDDNRWKELDHRGWSNGEPCGLDAPYIPDELKLLLENPRDFERFENMAPEREERAA